MKEGQRKTRPFKTPNIVTRRDSGSHVLMLFVVHPKEVKKGRKEGRRDDKEENRWTESKVRK